MRAQTREAHRRRGLAQPPSLERTKHVEELRARVHELCDNSSLPVTRWQLCLDQALLETRRICQTHTE